MAGKLKVGIIGAGTIGKVHAEAYQATGEAELAAVCDIDAARTAALADKYGAKAHCGDYHELLKTDVDAVSVCVGNVLHKEVALAALAAGKHVLLEKPMAMNVAEAAEIADAARKASTVTQIAMVQRQNAGPQLVRRLVADGVFGEVYHMRAVIMRRRSIPGLGGWFTTRAQSGGGPLIDLGVHWFDLAMWLSGHWRATRCSGKTYAKFGPRMKDYVYTTMWAGPPRYDGVFDVEDYAAGMVRFADEATMTFEISWAVNAADQAYVEIMGTEGGARVLEGGQDGAVKIYGEYQGRVADIMPQTQPVNRFHEQARKFLAACRGERPPVVPVEEGLVVMKLIDAIYASSQACREVEIR